MPFFKELLLFAFFGFFSELVEDRTKSTILILLIVPLLNVWMRKMFADTLLFKSDSARFPFKERIGPLTVELELSLLNLVLA